MPMRSQSSVGKSDKALGKSKAPQHWYTYVSDSNASRSRSNDPSVGGTSNFSETTAVASEGANSPDLKGLPRFDIFEKLSLGSLRYPLEKALVHNRRPPKQQVPPIQSPVPSLPVPAQVPRYTAPGHDALRKPMLHSDQDTHPPPSCEGIDIVHDPSQPAKDIVVRMHVPLLKDFEDELEEFCRLRRFGLFQEAEDYFNANLHEFSEAPYVMIQHAEALLASGNYKEAIKLINQQSFSRFDKLRDNKDAKKLAINLELLRLLSQPKFPQHATSALAAAVDGLPGKLDAPMLGSTEVQTLSLSLRLLHYFVEASSQTYTEQTDAVRTQAWECCHWNRLYHDLLGQQRVWDLRDLMAAAIPVFGFENTLTEFLGVPSISAGLRVLVDDWIQPEYDASATLGLLDLFSSLILQLVGDGSQDAILLHHSTILAKSIQQHNSQHMKTRPFIQFILAKAAVETEGLLRKSDRRSLVVLEGVTVKSGAGVHLPIFVPARHSEKPGWESFHVRSATDSLQHAVNVALQAASYTGDYALQATAWKLLIYQSQEPRPLMDKLAHLQLELQDDKEGFLSTCLSKYLITMDGGDDVDLLVELDKLDDASDGSYLTWGFNASLLWAKSIIQGHLESSISGPTNDISGNMQDPGKFCRNEIYVYGSRIPERFVGFLYSAFNITAPRPLRVAFDDPQRSEQPKKPRREFQGEFREPRQASDQRAQGPSTTQEDELDVSEDYDGGSESGSNDADTDIDTDVRLQYSRAERARQRETQSWSQWSEVGSDGGAKSSVNQSAPANTAPTRKTNPQTRKPKIPGRPFHSKADFQATPPLSHYRSPLYPTMGAREPEGDREGAFALPNSSAPCWYAPFDSAGNEYTTSPHPPTLPEDYYSTHRRDLPIHSGVPPPHPADLPPPPWGFPLPPVYPTGMYYGPPQPPSRPGYFPVAGWPVTWPEDAARLFGTTDPQIQSNTPPHTRLLLENGTSAPKQIVPSTDDEWFYGKPVAQHPALPSPPVDARGNADDLVAAEVVEADSDDKNGSTSKDSADEDMEDDEDDDISADDGSPRVGAQDSLPKLDFPPTLLDDNILTVLVRSKADPQKGKVYTIDKEGVKKSDVVEVTGNPRQQSPSARRHSPSIRRRTSFHDTSSPGPAPSAPVPLRIVPDAPPPPRAVQSAPKGKGSSGGPEAQGSKKATDKKTAAEPGARQSRRRLSIIKADVPKSFVELEATEGKPGGDTPVASSSKADDRGRRTAPVASPSRAGTRDQHISPVMESPHTGKPAPQRGTKNTNQAYAETDGESDTRPDSPVDIEPKIGSETKAVPGAKDGDDKASVTAQQGSRERGEGVMITRAQTWDF